MRKAMEHIPAHILDWLEQKDFAALTAEERKVVTQYFSEEEYSELHATRQVIGWGTARETVAGKEELKQDLIARLRMQQPSRTIRLSALAAWRAAAIALFLISGGLTLYLFSFRTIDRQDSIIAATDTVYLNQDIAAHPIVIHDTFYIEKKEKKSRSYRQQQQGHPSPVYARRKRVSPDSATNAVAGTRRGEETENDAKGSSIKDDSLMKKFSFVTL